MSAVSEARRTWRTNMRQLDWTRVLHVAPLALALIAAIAVYWPALNTAFAGDDYVYLVSVQKLSFWHYVRVSLTPGSNDPTMLFAQGFFRPLYFLSYEPLERLFGNNVVPYHLVTLGIHLAGIVLVWVLAQRLTGRWLAAGVAAAIFAVHPVGVESVTWISSVNSAALPLGLGSWLCFLSAIETSTEERRRRWTLLGVSVLLFAGSVGFRETCVVFLVAMTIWYVLVPARRRLIESRLLDWRLYMPLVPFVLLGIAYLLVRTRLFTIPAESSGAYVLNFHTVHPVVGYWKLALVPLPYATGWEVDLQRAGVALILVAIPVCLVTRRWLLLSLIVGFLISVIPYSLSIFGVGARYFYFPSALFALAAGSAAVDLVNAARRFVPARIPVAAAGAAIVLGLAIVGYKANSHVHTWIKQSPDVNQTWLAELQAQYPTLPRGGTLYVADGPLFMQLFGGYTEDYTVWYYYPQVAHIEDFDPAKLSQLHLRPNDRVFIYKPQS